MYYSIRRRVFSTPNTLTLSNFSRSQLKPDFETVFRNCPRREIFNEADAFSWLSHKMPSIQAQERDTCDKRSSLISIDEGMGLRNRKSISRGASKYVSTSVLPLVYGALQ